VRRTGAGCVHDGAQSHTGGRRLHPFRCTTCRRIRQAPIHTFVDIARIHAPMRFGEPPRR
jgi:hypothetical protein